MNPLTSEQITQIAPDAASVKAAKGLGLSKWVLLEQHDHTIWGHCQGSGSNPYQTAVDLSGEPAFKCSCPSRKFPCKHALALLFLFNEQTPKFLTQTPPDWVTKWLDKRQQNQANKAAKAEHTAPVDPVAQQKRFEARLKKASEGLADLQLWLNDLLRNGLVQLRNNQSTRFHDMAKRMIDAQLPAIAGQLQQLANLPPSRQAELWWGLSKLHLLSQSFNHIASFDEAWQAEIYSRLGFPIAKESVLTRPAIMDTWFNIGHTTLEIDRGEAHYYWLYGAAQQQFAFILDFVIHNAPAQTVPVLVGAQYAGELCFYAGVAQQRAISKTWEILPQSLPLPPAQNTIAHASQQVQQHQQLNPFITYTPLRLDHVQLVRQAEHHALSDGKHILPIQLNETQQLFLLSETFGKPFTAFVLFHHDTHQSRLLSFSNPHGQMKVLSC